MIVYYFDYSPIKYFKSTLNMTTMFKYNAAGL